MFTSGQHRPSQREMLATPCDREDSGGSRCRDQAGNNQFDGPIGRPSCLNSLSPAPIGFYREL